MPIKTFLITQLKLGITKLKDSLNQEVLAVMWHHQKKIPVKQQVKLMTLMHNLLSSGFNLSEMIHFLDRSKLVDQTFVTTMRTCLSDGQSLSQIFSTLQFSESVVTQVALSDHHGNLSQTLALITNNLTSKAQVRHKLIAVSTYPLILVVTLIVMMVGMKNYLLPQVGRENIASIVLHYLPTGILSLSGLLITAVLLFRLYFRKTSA